MNRCFTSKQVKDKVIHQIAVGVGIVETVVAVPGNAIPVQLPAHFDSMMEFWGSKDGFRRESLFSTDDEPLVSVDSSDGDDEKKVFSRQSSSKGAKSKSEADVLEAGLVAVKDGLVSLGQAMLQSNGHRSATTPNTTEVEGATLTDVVDALTVQSAIITEQSAAISEQSTAITKLLEHLLKK
ncbi:hypothetical protein AaE_015909 [Aphanomyces astaci]|uniref:Uncharacterized protein n=1 Tax=Aphanomyces astaci TaxID=112090 RepID=A0A6A4YY52_APHAT|nr:hypothetical protein AaE_015909 [Aphanomyces astaci]